MPSIATVSVAFNAASILTSQIQALLGQTTPINEIIVIDNASTDRTAELLTRDFPQVTVIRLSTNEGVGGAYAVGLQYAVFEKNYEWVWTLDGDSTPLPNSLAGLLGAYETHLKLHWGNIAVLAPQAVNEFTGHIYKGLGWKDGMVDLPDEDSQPILFVDLVISSGSLIFGEAVRKTGLPRRDFFMDFVDFEYCLRFRRNGYLIAVVKDSIMAHAIGDPQKRNLLGLPWVWQSHAPWREYYKLRNIAYFVWHQQPTVRSKFYVLRKLLRRALGILLFESRRIERLSLMFIGLRDGIYGRLGIRVRPSD